jgi:hypothetical protein
VSRENPALDASKPAFLCGLHRGLLADAPDEELTLGHFGDNPCAACCATPTTYHWLKWRRVSAERDELVAFLREHGERLGWALVAHAKESPMLTERCEKPYRALDELLEKYR